VSPDEEDSVRLAVSGKLTEEKLAFGRQIGATDFVSGDDLPLDAGYFRFQDLVILRNRIEDAGLRLSVVSLPEDWTYKIKLGLPGRDEQIANWRRSIENIGAAGIGSVLYFFSLRSSVGNYGLRTSRTTPGRGGAKMTSFDYDEVRGAKRDFWSPPVDEWVDVTDDQIWANVTYFLEAVVPTAEEAGVRLALHPDDPPISTIGGVARVFRSHAALRRLVEIVPSDSNCLTFCQGTISEMPENVLDAIRYFGSRNKICLVHFRNVSGTVPSFSETFIDDGHVDMLQAMRLWKEVGYDGPVVEDHVPQMVGDPDNQVHSVAFAMGYIKGLMDAVDGGT
jgi:mannonate dehydratase